jgi:hypothetical protein
MFDLAIPVAEQTKSSGKLHFWWDEVQWLRLPCVHARLWPLRNNPTIHLGRCIGRISSQPEIQL